MGASVNHAPSDCPLDPRSYACLGKGSPGKGIMEKAGRNRELMDGWMDVWIDGWLDGMDGWMDGWVYG